MSTPTRHPMFFDSDSPADVAATAEQQGRAPRRERRPPTWAEVEAMVAAARAAGTYNDHFETVCGGCGEWCDGHYVGKLGRCCAPPPPPEIQRLGPSTLVLITPAAPGGQQRGGS